MQFLVAALAVAVLIAMSHRANRQYARVERLPMQWSVGGKVNWTAPRGVALAFTPVLAGLVLIFVSILTTVSEPRRGQEGFEVPVILFMGLTFIAAHAFHLRLVNKSIDLDDR